MKVTSLAEAMQYEGAAVDILLNVARPLILQGYTADSCILSTAVTIDVLRLFGITAQPVPVQTMVFNAPFVERIENGAPWPTDPNITEAWNREDGSWALGIGSYGATPNEPGKWPGHLVAVTRYDLLIDLALDQGNRPEYGIELSPLAMRVQQPFLEAKSQHAVQHCNCVLSYQVKRGWDGYKQARDWKDVYRRWPLVQEIARQIKASWPLR